MPVPQVLFNPPPEERIHSILDSINKAVKELPNDTKIAILGVVNETHGNIVIVNKFNDNFVVEAWIGKYWEGSMNYGVQVKFIIK